MNKKSICIIFPFQHLAYSPTILNLIDLLGEYFEVDIFSIEPTNFVKYEEKNVQYISLKKRKLEKLYFKLFKKWDIFGKKYETYDSYIVANRLRKLIIKKKYDQYIAVDFEALFILQSMKINKINFISLEISPTAFDSKVNKQNIQSVLIQRQDRYDYLFKDIQHKVFFVQNAPTFQPIEIPNDRNKSTLLFCGTASKGFGAPIVLNFIEKYKDYKVHFKGTVYDEIKTHIYTQNIESFYEDRIIMDNVYTDEKNMIDFIKKFRIGFCFYDMRYPEFNNFNYQTAPSGKLFKYFAAGVPVIGSDILGLSYVKEYEAGVLLEKPTAENIKKAIEKIENNYDFYVNNALKIAKELSFKENITHYIDFLKK